MKLKQLEETRAEIVKEINVLSDTVVRSERNFTEDELTKFDSLEKQQSELLQQIETIKRTENAKRLVSPEYKEAVNYRPNAPTPRDEELVFRAWSLRQGGKSWAKMDDSMKRAVDKMAFDIDCPEVELVVRAQTVGTAAEGGYLTSTNIFSGLIEARATKGGVRSVASVQNVPTGETRAWATYDGTANRASIVGENTTISNVNRTLGQLPIPVYKYATGTFPVSHELLQDANVDLTSLFNRNLAVEIVRGQEYHWTLGTGSSQPYGVITGASSAVTSDSATEVDADELQDLMNAVDISYHDSAVFMMHQSQLSQIHKLVDDNSRPLFLSDYINTRNKTLYGFPVVVNNYMETGASKKAVLFGDFKGYQIVEALTVTISAQVYPLDDYTAFVAKARSGGRTLDTGAFKAITMHA